MAAVGDIILTEIKGQYKSVTECEVKSGVGLAGDMHRGNPIRMVSLMGQETIDKITDLGLNGLCTKKFTVNITTRGVRLYKLSVGGKFKITDVLFEVTQIGKECFTHCSMKQKSSCPLPRECVFAKALSDGIIHVNDEICIL